MNDRYLIWGTGRRARLVYEYLYKLEMNNKPLVVAFVDNDEKKQGINFEGLPVIAPSKIKTLSFDYITIASTFRDEILDSINKIGIPNEKIKDILEDHWREVAKYDSNIPVADCKLSIVAIMKNFANGIEEWMEYYLLVGVSHFYIYDNESEDNLKEKLKQYIEKGIVTYNFIHGKRVQIQAYNHAICHYKYESEYMAFIDDDEFIVPVEDKILPEVIEEIIEINKDKLLLTGLQIGGIGINWRMYGTSFHKSHKEGLVIENYKYRAGVDDEYNNMIKTICNPRTVEYFEVNNPHGCLYKDGFCCINERGIIIPSGVCQDNSCNIIRINHYRSKSEEEVLEKFKRGWGVNDHKDYNSYIKKGKKAYNLEYIRENYNKERDDIMDRYIPVLKQKLSQK